MSKTTTVTVGKKDQNSMNDNSTSNPRQPRRRGLTSMTLQWIADKLRRTDRIKEELSAGTYQVDSAKVAQAMVGSQAPGKEDSHR
jgi:anti-sigma28 factor (negative regulator of flagellin synthesis)